MADYVLFDNRTRVAGLGPDWGLKAASGGLASDHDLQAEFLSYCGASRGDSVPRAFGEALGGFCVLAGGYMVCVTVEGDDLRGRPSYAIVGFWFRNPSELQLALRELDVVARARAIADGALEARAPGRPAESGHEGPSSIRRCESTAWQDSECRTFVGGGSVAEVAALMARACDNGEFPSGVLGITSAMYLPARYAGRFARIYTTHGNGVQFEPGTADLSPAVVIPELRPLSLARPARFVPLVFLAMLVVFVPLIGTRLVRNSSDVPIPVVAAESGEGVIAKQAGPPPGAVPPSAPAVEQGANGTGSVDLVANSSRVVQAFDALSPARLIRTQKSLRMMAPHADAESDLRLKRAIERLLAARNFAAASIGDSLAYYTRDSGNTLPDAERLRGLRHLLTSWRPDSSYCTVLATEFHEEFQSPRSVLRPWCRALDSLDALAEEAS